MNCAHFGFTLLIIPVCSRMRSSICLLSWQVLHKRIPCREQEQSLVLTAVENNWIHSRQKRREQKRQLRELPRAPHWVATSSQTAAASAARPKNPPSQNQPASKPNSSDTQGDVAHKETTSVPEETGNGCSSSKDETRNAAGEQSEVSNDVSSKDVDMESAGPKETAPAANEPPTQRPSSPGAAKHFLFKCLLNVMLEGSDVLIEMHYVEGQNKDLLNQLCTYLKNSLLKSIARPWPIRRLDLSLWRSVFQESENDSSVCIHQYGSFWQVQKMLSLFQERNNCVFRCFVFKIV